MGCTLIKRTLAICVCLVFVIGFAYPASNAAILPDNTNRTFDVVDNSLSDTLMDSLLLSGTKVEKNGGMIEIANDELVSIIVTLEGAPLFAQGNVKLGTNSSSKVLSDIAKEQDSAIEAISNQLFDGKEYPIKYRYSTLLNGFSMTAPYGMLSALNKIPGIKNACVSGSYSIAQTTQSDINNAEKIAQNSTKYKGDGTLIAILDTGLQFGHPMFSNNVANAKLTYNDVVRAVATLPLQSTLVLDGVTADDLYVRTKIPFQFDYAHADTNASHDGTSYHGTHVAGIAAGNEGVNNEVLSVAPHAQLAIMKVFMYQGNTEVAYTEDLYAAMEDCSMLGVDVLNMSLGSPCGFTSFHDMENFNTVLDNCVNAGVILASAAGNEDSSSSDNLVGGSMYTTNPDTSMMSSPASYLQCLAVASDTGGKYPTMSTFSSWGAASDLTLKPEITSWGTNVYSAMPTNNYTTLSGTSMATPQIAGGIAVIKQYLREKYPHMSNLDTQGMATTLIMNTASHVKYSSKDSLYVSPRQQGAGRMNLQGILKTNAYITVPGSARPVIDQFDDSKQCGVYTFKFDIHNFGQDALTYKIDVTTLTETVTQYKDSYNNILDVIGESAYKLNPYVYTDFKDDLITINAGKTTAVTVTVMLSRNDLNYITDNFENGIYVEGFIDLIAQNEESVDLTVPYLGFCGDWTKPAVIDNGYYYDMDDTKPIGANTYKNSAMSTANGQSVYLGLNPYHSDSTYSQLRNAISPNRDGKYDDLSEVRLSLLRNSPLVEYSITDSANQNKEYLSLSIPYARKTYYHNTGMLYVGYNKSEQIPSWHGIDSNDKPLQNNTMVTFNATATVDYDLHNSNNAHDTWSFPITIDVEAPTMLKTRVSCVRDKTYVYLTVKDNQFVSDITFADAAFNNAYASYALAEDSANSTSTCAYDISGYGKNIGIVVSDYACNKTSYLLNIDNSAEQLSVTQNNTVYFEGFSGESVPNNWELESSAKSTWHAKDGAMTLTPNNNEILSERLISNAFDLSKYDTETALAFSLNTDDYSAFLEKNFRVMLRSDSSSMWYELFDLSKYRDASGNTQFIVHIPFEYQSKNIQVSFLYEGKATQSITLDDVILFDTGYNLVQIAGYGGDEATDTIDKAINVIGGTLTFENDAKHPWIVDNSNGRSAAQTNINGMNNTVTVLNLTADKLKAGTVFKFEWRVSSENSWDCLRFYVNGVRFTDIFGERMWNSVIVPINTDGNYTFTWKYIKDSSTDSGSDCAWIDRAELITPINVSGIDMETTQLSLIRDDYSQLDAVALPLDATMSEIYYTSSNEHIATVDEAGVVHAVAVGVATITATTVSDDFCATCEVSVSDYPAMPDGYAMIVLSAGDLWNNFSGYQMLLDSDANTYGTVIPTYGPMTSTGSLTESTRELFEYSIPQDCSSSCSVYNSVINDTQCIFIPEGVYDFAIINPVTKQKIWIADLGLSRSDDFKFKAGMRYVFDVSLQGGQDSVLLNTEAGNTYTPITHAIGDVNMDNLVNTGDAVLILRYTVELTQLSKEQMLLADFNKDGTISSGDATVILRHIISK